MWPTDEAVLELRVCACGSTISAICSYASTKLAVTSKR
jgi:hypothetical protein